MSTLKEDFRDAIGCVIIPAVVMAVIGAACFGCILIKFVDHRLNVAPPAACTCPALSEGSP